MKNLFLILTLIALTFQSCSSDDESINDPMVEASKLLPIYQLQKLQQIVPS